MLLRRVKEKKKVIIWMVFCTIKRERDIDKKKKKAIEKKKKKFIDSKKNIA